MCIALRVHGLPAPGVGAHGVEVPDRGPVQFPLRQGRIGVDGGDVAGAAAGDLVGDRAAGGFFEGLDDLEDAVPPARAEIAGEAVRTSFRFRQIAGFPLSRE